MAEGPCAKTTVTCTLVTATGEHIVGTNYCENAQASCPRHAGEDYTKCRTICRQVGHAEVVALMRAGHKSAGSRAFIEGHTYACQNCQEALFAAGVISISVGIQPEGGER
jgi:deoxycytidylate deaminase